MLVMQLGATGIGGDIGIRWTQCTVQEGNAQKPLMPVLGCSTVRHVEGLPATEGSSCEAYREGKCDLGRHEHSQWRGKSEYRRQRTDGSLLSTMLYPGGVQ
jgi:hypothetical protein